MRLHFCRRLVGQLLNLFVASWPASGGFANDGPDHGYSKKIEGRQKGGK